MAVVTLIEYTGKGCPEEGTRAADLLIYAKSTRLQTDPDSIHKISAMPMSEKLEALQAAAQTIRSSWEFIDVTFLIERVSRACAQQMTRTRNASFAMQSQRVVSMDEASFENPFKEKGEPRAELFENACTQAVSHYRELIDSGASKEAARAVLPLATHCNLLAKYNFRAFVELVAARSSLRTQDEYAAIVAVMKARVIAVWPWSRAFFQHPSDLAAELLEEVARDLGVETGEGVGWKIAKAIDLIRKA